MIGVTKINGRPVIGINSGAPGYRDSDSLDAVRGRDDTLRLFPEVKTAGNLGQTPNNAFFHAEATVLFRAARENGGMLEDMDLEVTMSRPMCFSCKTVLPYLGLRLGNPRVTFVDPSGIRRTMHNGAWQK